CVQIRPAGNNTPQWGYFFSFTPIKMYTMKVPMNSKHFCITRFFVQYANELYTNRICPKYTQLGLYFSFTPTTIKLYIVKVYMKRTFFCITMNLNMHMSSTPIEYVLTA